MHCWVSFLHIFSSILALTNFAGGDDSNSSLFDPFEYDDFDGIPGMQMEFKIEVVSGTMECFYQKIKLGAKFFLSFEVLRGSPDRNIDVLVRRPDNTFFIMHTWVSDGMSEEIVDMAGVYMICIDNTVSKYSRKLVYFYMATYLSQDWVEFAHEVEQFDVSFELLQTTADHVREQVLEMRNTLMKSRQIKISDEYQAMTNMNLVKNWSLMMIATIVGTSALQVYFVRTMFKTTNVTPTMKPRA